MKGPPAAAREEAGRVLPACGLEVETEGRRALRMMLEGGGYRVMAAGAGVEALAVLTRVRKVLDR